MLSIKIRSRLTAWSVKKDTENTDSKVVRTNNNRLLLQPTCSDCKSKKSRLVK